MESTVGILLLALLLGGYLGLGSETVRRALGARLPTGALRWLVGPAVLLLAVVLYSAAAGLPLAPRIGIFGAYLLAPVLVLRGLPPSRFLFGGLAAALLLWLPIEFDLLPPLPLPPPLGLDVARFVGLVAGLYLFLVARPLEGIGYTFRLRGADVRAALLAFVAFSVLALPIGFATGFIAWSPDPSPARFASLALIFLAIAVPEEFLFRGLIQNLLTARLGPAWALGLASVVFGLAHLPDPRYVLLATLAGVAYGWVYLRTGTITAAAVTHAAVDWVWSMLLGG